MATHHDDFLDTPEYSIDNQHHTDIHLPLHCQLQKILLLMNKFKHNTTKSAIAIDAWVTTNKTAELREESIEIQRIIRSDLNKIIDLTSNCKAEASKLISTLHECKGKNDKLTEELKLKTEQCDALKLQVDELNFSDLEIRMEETDKEKEKASDK
ncbi:uncharacterized protein LOC134701300 isoform X1 [Mytilus trossulus]|uniref:uncharacterized protein LOC134701300 isoform X1 n=1 Tax=Mytilus trossulus TaxID=6551 RepID=UPI003004988B